MLPLIGLPSLVFPVCQLFTICSVSVYQLTFAASLADASFVDGLINCVETIFSGCRFSYICFWYSVSMLLSSIIFLAYCLVLFHMDLLPALGLSHRFILLCCHPFSSVLLVMSVVLVLPLWPYAFYWYLSIFSFCDFFLLYQVCFLVSWGWISHWQIIHYFSGVIIIMYQNFDCCYKVVYLCVCHMVLVLHLLNKFASHVCLVLDSFCA